MREYQLRNPFNDPPIVREKPDVASDEAAFLPTQSQAAPSARRPHTVSEITELIRVVLEESFASIWVEGEISEPKYHTSGHIYFTLKDSQAELKSVLWRSNAASLRFRLEQGLKVVCRGRIGVYPQRGSYQLYVETIEPKGIGALQLAFEQMVEKLQKEGLFSEERKRPLPVFPERVGIVTSPTGAAIDDMLKILRGKAEIVLRPARVQGEGAVRSIVRGIQDLNANEGLDLLIVGRGGGSLEDLWPFNDEEVARAIVASRLPVISAVGHEHNLMISDLAADVRAPTPTKAAEMVVTRRRECLDRLAAVLEDPLFTQPEEWITERQEQVEEFQQALVEGLREPILTAAHRLRVLHGDLLACSPQAIILQQAERLHSLHESLDAGMARSLEQTTSRFLGLAGRLNALSPLACLERGYSITFDAQGKIVKEAATVKPGEQIQTRLHRGRVTSRVEATGD